MNEFAGFTLTLALFWEREKQISSASPAGDRAIHLSVQQCQISFFVKLTLVHFHHVFPKRQTNLSNQKERGGLVFVLTVRASCLKF